MKANSQSNHKEVLGAAPHTTFPLVSPNNWLADINFPLATGGYHGVSDRSPVGLRDWCLNWLVKQKTVTVQFT